MFLIPLGVLAALLLVSPSPFTAKAAASFHFGPNITHNCHEIASAVSSASAVFFPGTDGYDIDIRHFYNSSAQESVCSFEPGTAKDLGIAINNLGTAEISFAVKSGGFAVNQGFSSTPGVQIALRRLSNVTYDKATQTAKIGAGLVWDDVYAALEPYGVNVVGARSPGIGVGGFTLGGGYSWHTNQYGLAIDMVEAFELVLPNGTVTNVDASQPDLFFALRGGGNNFGIVTQFTVKTFPQGKVWGGSIAYNPSEVDHLVTANANFAANNTDPKASVVVTYWYARQGNAGENFATAVLFYDGPSPPTGLFDEFLTPDNNASVFARSFLSLVQSSREKKEACRTAGTTVSVLGYPEEFLRSMIKETKHWGSTLPGEWITASYTAEPLVPNVYNHTTSPSAWPGSRSFFSPSSLQFKWPDDGSNDDSMISALKSSAANLQAKAPGTEKLSLYVNYALADTPLEAMYGDNVNRLKNIALAVDPDFVMTLTGGFNLEV